MSHLEGPFAIYIQIKSDGPCNPDIFGVIVNGIIVY